jgi:alkylation response protein AidB-like acyl-CoA dehydrogenase
LAERGYIERAVPGIGKGDPIELWVLFNEMEKAAAPSDALSVIIIFAGIINRVGTSAQRERILPSLLAGESLACLGYSEPGCGSDLAAGSPSPRM